MFEDEPGLAILCICSASCFLPLASLLCEYDDTGIWIVVVTVLIGFAVTVAAVILLVVPKLNKLLSELTLFKSKLSAKSDAAVTDRSGLHKELRVMRDDLCFLREAWNNAPAAKNMDLDKTVGQLAALYHSIEQRDQRIAELTEENRELRIRLAQLSMDLTPPQPDDENSLDL
mgnify:CR=1 FL=1